MPSLPAFSHHEIYEAALDPEAFAALPARFAGALGTESCFMMWYHPGARREFVADTHAEVNAHYEAEFTEHDLWFNTGFAPANMGRAIRLSELVPERDYRSSVYYNEFIRPNRLDKYWCMAIASPTRDGTGVIALHRGARDGDFRPEDQAFLGRHARDINRMMEIRRELQRNVFDNIAVTRRTLSEGMPGFELDAEARLLRINSGGETLLKAHPAFALRRGRLAFAPDLAGMLQGALARATGTGEGGDRGHRAASVLELPPTIAPGRVPEAMFPALTLNVLPRTDGGRHALIIVTSHEPRELASGLYPLETRAALTEREKSVLILMSEGMRRDRVAHTLAISVPTVDLHLKNARRKLGATTLIQAVRNGIMLGVL